MVNTEGCYLREVSTHDYKTVRSTSTTSRVVNINTVLGEKTVTSLAEERPEYQEVEDFEGEGCVTLLTLFHA
ncbi:MAG: hypothetical protein GY820_03165 [Gammaproteobacteria bacterium]|nr:hypothetical protein [Gammaproteobacteria bacterium]